MWKKTSHRSIGYLTKKRKVVKELKSHAASVENVYLATDPDREGEAIAWHLLEAAEIDPEIAHRVVFMRSHGPRLQTLLKIPVISI